jgi:hypothetical protein
MSAIIVLVIVVATQNVDDQATESMRATAAEAIGGEDAVVMRELETPSDPESLRIERSLHSLAVAQVVWLDAARTRASVRVHVAETNRWTERTVVFKDIDTPTERGRALGFAVTSMLPEEAIAASPYRMTLRPDGSRAGGPSEPARTALRLSGIGSAGIGGEARGIGAAGAGEFLLTRAMWLRLGFGLRQGNIPGLTSSGVASAEDLAFYGGLGVAFWPVRPSAERRVAVGVRIDGLVLYHGVSRTPQGGSATRLTKWLPGADALAEVAWNVAGSLEIVASVGVEVALGNTDLQVITGDDEPRVVATIPPLRGVGEVGIRLLF